MAAEGDSFLPRILSVFYAVFDDLKGSRIVYQVPEGLIASNTPAPASCVSPGSAPFSLDRNDVNSRGSSASRNSLTQDSCRPRSSPQKRSTSLNTTLFNFEDISRYVIPQSALCGRLVICATRKHRVIGFPVELYGDRYERNYFRYNLSFVFERRADLSCYEPIVRKIGRVLTACEEESCFLSSPSTSHTVYAILEQLYEDLNSYAETSISIDKFNSIELKIFPFYPNPPPVRDWMVPVALINLTKRIEPNWDLTLAKVCPFIDGTNHVSRIAHLADCDIDLARKAISHLLFYQVIMMIDIFQYSNMYTLRKSVQWLADESHVRDECGPYVTKPDKEISDWPQLLHLYSRLKPGKTVFEWMQEYDVHHLGVDPRRFTSFGVIKGFLRRVHRWPVLLPEKEKDPATKLTSSTTRKRGKSLVYPPAPASVEGPRPTSNEEYVLTSPARRASTAEAYLEQFRKDVDTGGAGLITSPRASRFTRTQGTSAAPSQDVIRRHSLQHGSAGGLRSSIAGLLPTLEVGETASGAATPTRPRLSRSPSAHTVSAAPPPPSLAYPPDLRDMLDGTHHSDELGVRFEAGWPRLEKYLVALGGGAGNGDFGRVEIIYR